MVTLWCIVCQCRPRCPLQALALVGEGLLSPGKVVCWSQLLQHLSGQHVTRVCPSLFACLRFSTILWTDFTNCFSHKLLFLLSSC